MNRKAFVQDKSADFLLKDEIWNMPKDRRLDAAISLAEALWERLKDRGYGPTTKTSERSSQDYYSELNDQEYFDKCWSKYGKQGCRNKAAKAWIDIPEAEKPKIFPAIPKYLEDIKLSGITKAHFSTWLNDQRWLNYETVERKAQPSLIQAEHDLATKIKGLEQMMKATSNEQVKATLQLQLDKLKYYHSSESD